jgi:hypothetical protein
MAQYVPLYRAQREAQNDRFWQYLVNLFRRLARKPVVVTGAQRYHETMACFGWDGDSEA